MNHTPNYNLSQWAKSDRVLMDDFNADNAKIDAALAGFTAALTQKGNCQIVTGSYTGSGKVGPNFPNSLTFNKTPVLLFVCGPTLGIMVKGGSSGYMLQAGTSEEFTTAWDQNSVSWYRNGFDLDPCQQMNESGKRYYYLAFLTA